MQTHFKERLLASMNYRQEFDELLGTGKGTTRSCFNKAGHSHGDKVASLSFNPSHGGWKCHSCQEQGDIFSLYMKMKDVTFPMALEHYLRKYGMWSEAGKGTKPNKKVPKPGEEGSPIRFMTEKKELDNLIEAVMSWAAYPEHVSFMYERYGLTLTTLRKYYLGFNAKIAYGRLLIPVWADKIGTGSPSPNGPSHSICSIVNIRKQDVFRTNCVWEHQDGRKQTERPKEITFGDVQDQTLKGWAPKWPKDKKMSKVFSVAGYGTPYLYPISVLKENDTVYLVGGELKALLLNQLGVPAVCFSGGEGYVSLELLPLFIGKRVRVLNDPDNAGVLATFGRAPGTNGPNDRGTMGSAQLLANAGAYVEAGEWPAEVTDTLPPKGDVNDFLRLLDWKTEGLEYLIWHKVERQLNHKAEEVVGQSKQLDASWEEMQDISFRDLVNPEKFEEWVKFNAIVTGRGASPFVVPRRMDVTCDEGRLQVYPQCSECRLPTCGFRSHAEFSTKEQLSMVGLGDRDLHKVASSKIMFPLKCKMPKVEWQHSVAEKVILTPTVDVNSTGDDKQDFEFAHRSAVVIREERVEIRDNTSYNLGGHLLRDPVNGHFTIALRQYRAAQGDILHFEKDEDKEARLRGVLDLGIPRLIEDLRDHTCRIYGQQDMLQTILLSYFLPLQFKFGDGYNERICPAVLILGDTTTGKSTTTKRIGRLFGAGRFRTLDSKPTFAGLVGGNIQQGQGMAFSWGLIPSSHRGEVALDEFSKLPTEDIGRLTNLLSSGVAERITANGDRSTMCHVRMLYLSNPRGSIPLEDLDPYSAAKDVMGTVQDLGRVEYLHIQQKLKDKNYFSEIPLPTTENLYTSELARYHLSFMWSLTPDRFRFYDHKKITEMASRLAAKFRANTLLLPANARYKLARIAAGFAALEFSTDGWNLVIQEKHARQAYEFIEKNYETFLDYTKEVNLPLACLSWLDHCDMKAIAWLLKAKTFSKEELEVVVGVSGRVDFEKAFMVESHLVSLQFRRYTFRDAQTLDRLKQYAQERVQKAETQAYM